MTRRRFTMKRRRYTNVVVPSISMISDVTASDAGGTVVFGVSLNNPSAQTITVNYATADGSATAGNDYTAASGTLTFTPGEVYKEIPVTILGDVLVEGAETFTCVLSNPTNASIARAVGTCTLTDDNTSEYGKPAANLGSVNYYGNNWPYINLVRHTYYGSSAWTSANYPTRSVPVDSNGWLSALPNTDIVKIIIWYDLNTQNGYIRPGNYKVATSANVTVSIVGGSGIINNTSGTGAATFTVATSGTGVYDSSAYNLWVQLENNSGGPVNVTDLAVYHVDDETDYLAGKLFQAAFLASLQNLNTIRVLDWTRANANTDTQPYTAAMLPTENTRSWSLAPYSVMGKLINELKAAHPGADPWLNVNIPCGMEYWGYKTDVGTSTFTAWNLKTNAAQTHGWSNGQQVVLYGYKGPTDSGWPSPLSKGVAYYVVNAAATTFQLALTEGGAAVALTGTSQTASHVGFCIGAADIDIASLAASVFNSLYAAAPTIKVKAEYTNEPWNTAFPQYHWLHAVAALQAGSSLHMPSGYAYGSLVTWQAAVNAGYARANVKRVMNGQAANWAGWSGMLEYVDPGVITLGASVKNLIDQWMVAPYCPPCDEAGVTMSTATMIANGYGTADDATWTAAMTRGVNKCVSRVLTHIAGLAAKNPSIEFTSYEGGHGLYRSGTQAGLNALAARFQDWLDSAAGLAWAQDYRQRVYIANNMLEMCWYHASGHWIASESNLYCWGMKQGTHNTDTAISSWFASL